MKLQYKNEFSRYEYSFPGYAEAIKKINKMENAILGNKIKIELMQEKIKMKERENRMKLAKVKKLNSSSNNS